MAQQPAPTVENHFIAGLKTEFTGLNFPENAATDTQNCVFSLIGDVTRRGGINYEDNFVTKPILTPNTAKSSFRWLNAGGDGQTQILVVQIGATLYFYLSSAATLDNPLSTTLIASNVNILQFQAAGNTANVSQVECQYTSGNGYLFVFHPDCDPFYCTYAAGAVTSSVISLQIRDFVGIPEPGVPDTQRPSTLSAEHTYNLVNQGWSVGANWTGSGSYNGNMPTVGQIFTLSISSQANTTVITNGSELKIVINPVSQTGANNNNNTGTVTILGVVNNYVSPFTSVTIAVSSVTSSVGNLNLTGYWSGGNFFQGPASTQMSLVNVGFITAWKTALGNYPSNSDIWWLYKDTSDAFNPATTFANVQPTATPAPKGSLILNPFNQDRSFVSGVGGLTTITTLNRPSTGTFYAGRVWFSGINASQLATGDEPFTTWTENIYFSQIAESPQNFGRCYQTNDPTSQTLFALLPSDGGVINIPGCGAIYKLFPLRFGLLVFAANGIWFISGSSGIGFTANDFTVTKISTVQTISATSFLDVLGYPMFWNQEGIYHVTPSSDPGSAHSPDIQLSVTNLALGTILTYYNSIPLVSKIYPRGDYDFLNFVVQWVFRSTDETGIGDRYTYDTILNYNTVTKAFYPSTLPTNSKSTIIDIKYVQNPGGFGNPSPILKYATAIGNNLTFSEENDFTNWTDFISENETGYDYTSYFITGYKLIGQSLRKFQMPYLYLFSRNSGNSSVGVQSIWDFAGSAQLGVTNTNSGRWSTRQVVSYPAKNFVMSYRKIRLRGRGLAAQIKVTSIGRKPFDLMGWSIWNEVNAGI